MKVTHFFAEPFLYGTPNVSDEEKSAMLEYLKNCPKPGKDDLNYTGDVDGDTQIITKDPFVPLQRHIHQYVEQMLSDITTQYEDYDIHVVKSWPVVVHTMGRVSPHAHRGNSFSFVYYLQVAEQPIEGGHLVFHRPNHHSFFDMGFSHENLDTMLSKSEAVLVAEPGALVIFPSNMTHEVVPYYGVEPRYSVSGDILLTRSKGKHVENQMPDPSTWVTV